MQWFTELWGSETYQVGVQVTHMIAVIGFVFASFMWVLARGFDDDDMREKAALGAIAALFLGVVVSWVWLAVIPVIVAVFAVWLLFGMARDAMKAFS